MVENVARSALKLAKQAAADLAQHIALCNEMNRQAALDRAAILTNIAAVQVQVYEVRTSVLRILLSSGAGALVIALSVIGGLGLYLLDHLEKLVK